MPRKLSPEEKQKREIEKRNLAVQKAKNKQITKIKKDCIERIVDKKNLQKPTDWPRELAIINKLTQNYPNLEFWTHFNPNFSFQLPSMAWFLGEKGRDYLAQEYRRATTDLSNLINKEKEEIVFDAAPEQVNVEKKLRTLKDFLK